MEQLEAREARETKIYVLMDELYAFISMIVTREGLVLNAYINAIVDEFDPHTFYFAPRR